MNLKQAQIILEKISRLYKTMKMDERNIDAFEQDLMLSYIRQLYESFASEKSVSPRVKPVLPPKEAPRPAPPKPSPTPKAVVTPPAPAPKPEPPKTIEIEKPAPPPPPKVVTPPTPPPPPVTVERPAPVPTPPPAPTPPPTPKPEPAKPAVSSKGLSLSEQEELFGIQEASELSEKLGLLPIRDLTKAMGLNEKIFTINELFGGDSKLFDETIKTLNNFSSFEEAKVYLSAYTADRYNWGSKGNKKKALNFIKLVRRRYS